MKGVAGELELFEVRARRDAPAERVTDPVCGMDLTQAGVAAKLSLEGAELSFCLERCLALFIESRAT